MKTPISDTDFRLFAQLVCDASGIHLSAEKKYLLETRLSPLLEKRENATYYQLYKDSCSSAEIHAQVIDALTTKETYWFRMPTHYDLLRTNLLPTMLETIRRPIRIWSAACATGQEAYSLAITACEVMMQLGINPQTERRIEILATDISHTACTTTQAGVYTTAMMGRGISDVQRTTWFDSDQESWCAKPVLRRMIRAKQLNLIDDVSALGYFDIIFLRNVAIYFTDTIKTAVYERVAERLQPEGYLFLGTGESVSGFTNRLHPQTVESVTCYQRTTS